MISLIINYSNLIINLSTIRRTMFIYSFRVSILRSAILSKTGNHGYITLIIIYSNNRIPCNPSIEHIFIYIIFSITCLTLILFPY